MKVVAHNNISIQLNPVFIYKEPQAINNDHLLGVRL